MLFCSLKYKKSGDAVLHLVETKWPSKQVFEQKSLCFQIKKHVLQTLCNNDNYRKQNIQTDPTAFTPHQNLIYNKSDFYPQK